MTQNIPDSHKEENLKLEASPYVDLFEIVLYNGSTLRLKPGDDVEWNGYLWEGYPIGLTGHEIDSEKLSRPTLRVVNPEGIFSSLFVSGDLENKNRKLRILDEYFRLYRYQNNGKVYKSGKELSIEDCPSVSVALEFKKPSRNKNDIGIENNKFIEAAVNAPHYEYNRSIFTEEEKAGVYMCYHDTLPYELYKECELEEEYVKTMIDSRLQRPENTEPCHEMFRIDEKEIFVNPDDKLYRYYQVCPHCGYIVNIPKEILSEGVKQRIEERCAKDQNLFRKNYLYSELFALDKKAQDGQKRVLKN